MKNLCFILLLFLATNCFCQTDRMITTFLSFQVNKTFSDRTINNNPGGFGFGFQSFLKTNSRFKPTLEVNGDFFAGTKVMYLTSGGKPVYAKEQVGSIYLGASYHPTNRVFVSATSGPSFYNSATHFGIRPSIGLFPTKKKNWTVKVSYTNVFQRDEISNENFGYASLALALKLF